MSNSVLVIGMHRSGTSLVSQLLSSLGLVAPESNDLLPADNTNESGHWESKRLMRFNDLILATFLGTTFAPPKLNSGWQSTFRGKALAPFARASFYKTFPAQGWVWKDPQNCITLPFWLDALQTKPALVFVRRSLGSIVSSVVKRDGLSEEYALAIWERYLRTFFASQSGEETIICIDYDQLLVNPTATIASAIKLLRSTGVDITGSVSNSAKLVRTDLAHNNSRPPTNMSTQQKFLDDTISNFTCHVFNRIPTNLGGETPGIDRLFKNNRLTEVARLGHSINWLRFRRLQNA